MFATHTAILSMARSEPKANFDIEKREKDLSLFFGKLAEQIVLKNVLENKTKSNNKEKALKKLRAKIETDERLKTIKGFMESWNYWRDFYFQLGPIEPKNSQSVSMIENAIQFCMENEYDLHMMIGCIHRASLKRLNRPPFSNIQAYGAEYYEKFYNHVIEDLDKADYQTTSMTRDYGN